MDIKVFVEGPIDANNYLIIDEKSNEAVLIDCSSERQEFIDAIKSLDVNLKYILLTHGHFDHLLGIDKFREVFPSAALLINENDCFQVEHVSEMLQMFAGIKHSGVKPITNFIKDGDVLNIGNIEIKAIKTPGHTQGGMSYLIDNNLFSGDTLFRGSVGRYDLPGGNFKELVSSIKDKLFLLSEETIVYPGHGSASTIAYEKKYNEILNI